MVQAIAGNIALFCGALFAGGSVYISLVEHPATREGGAELASRYFLMAHPRPALVLGLFASVAALAGLAAGVTGGRIEWLAGGIVLALAAAIHFTQVLPATRRMVEIDPMENPAEAQRWVDRLARVHALLSLAGLAALFLFILHG